MYLWQGYTGNIELLTFSIFAKKTIRRVAVGGDHSLFLTSENEVYSYGKNNCGQLGIGSLKPDYSYDPLLIESLSDKEVVEVSCGRNHCTAVCSNGDVYCWGDSKEGQCGSEKAEVTSPEYVLIQLPEEVCSHGIPFVPEKAVIRQISCGRYHTLALSDQHEIWVWGSGHALGMVSVEKTIRPILLEYLLGKKVLSVSCGDYHTVALVERSESSTESDSTSHRSSVQCKTHRFFSSTCVECNEEIYSYTETSDTCIISDKHKCDNSLSSSRVSEADSSVSVHVGDPLLDTNITKNKSEEQTDGQLEKVESSRVSESAFQRGIQNMSQTDLANTENDDENFEIWQKRTSSSDESFKTRNNMKSEQHVEKLDNSSESSKTGNRIPKSRSFIDENEAREYLAKQMKNSSSESSRRENLSSASSILGQVSIATSKVIGDIKSSVAGLTSAQGVELVNFSKKRDSDIDAKTSVDQKDFTPTKSPSREATPSSAESSLCELPVGASSVSEDEEDSKKTKSIRTIWAKQEQFEKKNISIESDQRRNETKHIAVETEVWTWGKNNKGQLGTGDMLERPQPSLIKMLSNKCIIKVACGEHHTLALTANSQVYTWGLNSHGQLGHSELTATPYRIKLMSDKYVWDIGAGDTHSLFLIDGSGFKPDVFYSGMHPCKDLCVPVHKTSRLTALNFLKKLGWVRCIAVGGDNCACLVNKSTSGYLGTVYEVAASERQFFHSLNRIMSTIIHPMKKSSFYTSLDVFPYKSTLSNLLLVFIGLSRKIGASSLELTQLIRTGRDIMEARIFSEYENFVDDFKKYSQAFGDMLSVGGFEYCGKIGSSFMEKAGPPLLDLLEEGKGDKNNPANLFRQIMQVPLRRLKEYSRLANKLLMSYDSTSKEFNLLNRVSLSWDGLKYTITMEHTTADNTRAFWEGCSPKIADTLKIPSRRLLRESKANPLTLQNAGRFSNHLFLLFNDLFVHVQYASHQVYPLETVWVETPLSDTEQSQNLVVITMPEEMLNLCAATPAEKVEWLMMLNSAINKVLSSQKSVTRRGSAERLAPPVIRHASHTFTRHGIYKDATYNGYWMNSKLHGQGELRWSDGRKYVGNFKTGFQHGQGVMTIQKGEGQEEVQDGNWKEGRLHGLAKITYANSDVYEGYFKEGQKFGHGVYRQGRYMTDTASIYIGEWSQDKKQGYGVMDDILRGEKYMGMWQDDCRHGNGIVVTLDGMYFEGNFVQNKMTGFGLMLTDDNSSFEGEFSGITQLQGKGTLILPTGDHIEGMFNGSWNEGLKISGTFWKTRTSPPVEKKNSHAHGIKSSVYGTLAVPSDRKWEDLFSHCNASLGYCGDGKPDSTKAWESVAVIVSAGRKSLRDTIKSSPSRSRVRRSLVEDLETIPPHGTGKLTLETFSQVSEYLKKAFETPIHPLGRLMEGIVSVFRATYIGVGAHPRLLHHAIEEIKSYVSKMYKTVRILFSDLPPNGGPLQVFPASSKHNKDMFPKSTEEVCRFFQRQISEISTPDEEEVCEVVSADGLLHPILLPKIYPPLFDLYALYNDKEDEKYWERIQRLNRQGDMALMAYLGIDQKFWLIDESLFNDPLKKLSSVREQCYAEAVDCLQQLSTAFGPAEKLKVLQNTFIEISKAVQQKLGDEYVWCMDDLFPIFQYVVVRAKIHHLGAEIHLIDDLMESHLEYGELGIMFTTLKACYFQIQTEKMPS